MMITKFNTYIKEAVVARYTFVKSIYIHFDHIKNSIKLDDLDIEYIQSINNKITNLQDRIYLDNSETYYFKVAVFYHLIKHNKEITLSNSAFFENSVNIIFENIHIRYILESIDFNFKQSSEKKLIEDLLELKPEMINDYFVEKFIWYSNLEDIEIVKTLKNAKNFDLI